MAGRTVRGWWAHSLAWKRGEGVDVTVPGSSYSSPELRPGLGVPGAFWGELLWGRAFREQWAARGERRLHP